MADALQAAQTISPLHRQILSLLLERVDLVERQMTTLKGSIASALRQHHEAVMRLAAVPGFGIDSAEQVIAEVGPQAATFASPGQMASWVGVCPGREESAETSKSDRSPKGNRVMRRVLNQVANAAVKAKGSIFQSFYRRLLPRLGHNKAIWAVAHRLCRLTWKILHQQVEYIEYARQLRAFGYQVTPPLPQPNV